MVTINKNKEFPMSTKLTDAIIVKGNIREIYKLWANFENFPHFMKNIKSVTKTGDGTSHWVMAGPMGKDLEWDAQITELLPPKRIAWNSVDGNIKTSGEVTFNQLNHDETQITVLMQYSPPAGVWGDVASQLIADPDKRLDDDLRDFKKFAETRIA